MTKPNPRAAIVVLGRGGWRRPNARTDAALRDLVGAAEALVVEGVGDVVVLTGGSQAGRPSEAEQMLAAWQVPDVEVLLEPTAATTAENAARTLPLLLERDVRRVVVVCSPLHARRTRYFFVRLYEPHGIEVTTRCAEVAEGARALARELAAATLRRRQLRAVSAELLERVQR
jgi:uncharacterized SAM-binding protein YcdF (DUF218 family)